MVRTGLADPGDGNESNRWSEISRRFGSFRRGAANQSDNPEVAEMRKNRIANRKTGANAAGTGSPSSLSFATGRPRDPMFYWRQNNLPYDVTKDEELKKIREFCRLLYMTHPIIASCVDIFSKYPLLGMELVCKDEQLTEFYNTLFFDELHYEEFLIDVGREYWTVGEAWPFGSFNEVLGVWEDDELLNPDDCEVVRSPFHKEPRFLIRLPETIRKVLNDRQPHWEYEKLMSAYPELKEYAGEDALMPVSNILLKQLKFKGDTFHKRGIPILMRAFRAIMQEEMFMNAMDSIADRLYTPLILAKLGAKAQDLGTNVPWIPTEDDLADFEEALDSALAADFRVITHHFGIDMAPVLGRENMPNMDNDFDRIQERILQTFGLSKTMLSGADGGETYAADALNRDLISQLLTTYQKMIIELYNERAKVVAEAQEHYDYELRGGKRYPVMEEVLVVDEETGEDRIIEQPKLLWPELRMKTMQMKDEESQRQFVEALVLSGVPISIKTRLTNTDIDLEEETERRQDEIVQEAVAEQETRKRTYLALRASGLPIPQDLLDDFRPMASNAGEGGPPEGAGTPAPSSDPPIPMLGVDPVTGLPNIAPGPEDMLGAGEEGDPTMGEESGGVIPLPRNQILQNPNVPPESNEARKDMPKAAKRFQDPRHIGLRRFSGKNRETPLDEDS
jgi:hypothetical protein